MLSVGEQPHVLNILKAARFIHDPVAAEVYGTEESRLEIKVVEPSSPDPGAVNPKRADNNTTKKEDPAAGKSEKAKAEQKQNERALSSSDTTKDFAFKKEHPVLPPQTSLMSDTLQSLTQKTLMKLKIFMTNPESMKGDAKPVPMIISVAETYTAGQVIEAIRKQNILEDRPPLHPGPKAYYLQVADDGQPDEDWPPCADDKQVKNMGNKFCLVESKERDAAEKSEHEGMHIKIHLPESLSQGLLTTSVQTLAFLPGMTISALLWKVCHKWQLDFREMYFHLPGSTEPLPSGMTWKELTATEIVLSKKKNLEVEAQSEELQSHVFWSEHEAFKYKTFEVTKYTSNLGRLKKERILGLDNHRITLTSRRRGTSQTTVPTWRNMSELKGATVTGNKQKVIHVTFNKGKEYSFEAKTPQQAAEIVAKMKFCSAHASSS